MVVRSRSVAAFCWTMLCGAWETWPHAGSPTAGSDLELLAADAQLLESLPAPFLVVPALPEAFAHLSPNPASADSSARMCGRSLFPETGDTIITEEVRKFPIRK